MSDLEQELRAHLSRTWKALMGRLSESDFPPHVVYETLAEVATEGMVDRYGPSAATHMLRLRANAIEVSERNRVQELISGTNSKSDQDVLLGPVRAA